jgi:ribonuclease VapC
LERYGKGRHSAGLNIGVRFSYAVAAIAKAPLLFKGHDFGQTDLKRHPTSSTL